MSLYLSSYHPIQTEWLATVPIQVSDLDISFMLTPRKMTAESQLQRALSLREDLKYNLIQYLNSDIAWDDFIHPSSFVTHTTHRDYDTITSMSSGIQTEWLNDYSIQSFKLNLSLTLNIDTSKKHKHSYL